MTLHILVSKEGPCTTTFLQMWIQFHQNSPRHFLWDTPVIARDRGWQRENAAQGVTLRSSLSPDPGQTLCRPAAISLSFPHRAGIARPLPPKPLSLQPGNQGQTSAPDEPALLKLSQAYSQWEQLSFSGEMPSFFIGLEPGVWHQPENGN